MESPLHAFRRNEDGSWTCVTAVTFDGPGGRIQVAAGATFQPGTSFMGLDIAHFLDAQRRKGGFSSPERS